MRTLYRSATGYVGTRTEWLDWACDNIDVILEGRPPIMQPDCVWGRVVDALNLVEIIDGDNNA